MSVTLTKLLEQCGSPLYTYDYNTLSQKCTEMKDFGKALQDGLPDGVSVNLHYSTKSNNNIAILSVVEDAGLNVDCMSPFEFNSDRAAGFTLDRMLYVCNNITTEEMKFVHEQGVLICLDSISQVETWGKLFPDSDIMVRINPGVTGVGHSKEVVTSGKETKFGISEENLSDLFDVANKYNLHIVGTHQHLGSLFLNDKIPDYIAGVKAGLDIVKKYFKEVQIVDLGGGFGVPYEPHELPLDLSFLASKLLPILNEFVANYPSVKEFKFEPGRYIPCEAGHLLGTVTAIKHENGIYWIGTDVGMNQLVRPSMYKSYHEIGIIYKDDSKERPLVKVNFCGNVCESGDILGKNRKVYLPDIGDIVVINNAGAYGYSMASNYTGRPRPAEVMLKNDSITIIRAREFLFPKIENIIVNI